MFLCYRKKLSNKISSWASLVAQWKRICLPMQKTLVQSLGPGRSHMPKHHYYRAHAPHLLSLRTLEPTLHDKRNHCNEKPGHRNKELPLLTELGKDVTATKAQCKQKQINKSLKEMKGQKELQTENLLFIYSISSYSSHQFYKQIHTPQISVQSPKCFTQYIYLHLTLTLWSSYYHSQLTGAETGSERARSAQRHTAGFTCLLVSI